MTDKKYIWIEIGLVVILIVYIIFINGFYSGGTDKSIAEVSKPVTATLKGSTLSKKTNGDAVKAFGFELDKTDGIMYYAADNVMDVSEVLIVKLKDKTDAPDFEEKIRERVTNQENLYKGYAPKQYSLLQNSIVASSGNTVFYCTSKIANAIYEAYKNAL